MVGNRARLQLNNERKALNTFSQWREKVRHGTARLFEVSKLGGVAERTLAVARRSPEWGRVMSTNHQDWYALRVKTRQEQFVYDGLKSRGVESLLPSCEVKRQWSDRTKTLQQPLFPGYLFATFDFNNRLPILQTPGLIDIVSFGGVSTPVEPAEIEAIRAMVESKTPAAQHEFLSAGVRVDVVDGPMRGHQGYLVTQKNKHRLVLTVSLLMRAVSVEVDADHVALVSPQKMAGRC